MLLQNNQWSLELGDDLSGSPFELALAKAKAIVMVLDGGAVALTRIWCLVSALSPCLAIFDAVCAVCDSTKCCGPMCSSASSTS